MKNFFRLYKYGIYYGEVNLSEEILIKKVDVFTGEISRLTKYMKKDDEFFEFPIEDICNRIKEIEQVYLGNKTKMKLSNGSFYQKYKEIRNNGDKSTVWAERKVKNPIDFIIHKGIVIGFITMRRDGSIMLIKKGYEYLTPLKEYKDRLLSKPNHFIDFKGTEYVEMSDGCKLATDIYLPSNIKPGKKLPTILVRTPYGREIYGQREFRFVFRGYALVVQDTRGRGDSEGEFIPNIYEKEDGSDTLDYIASCSWSNGKVGMIGGSYGGYVQWAAAASGNKHLKAIVSLVTSGSAFRDNPRKGGVFMSGILAWCSLVSERDANPDLMNRDDWDEVVKYRPVKDIPEKMLGKKINFWDDWVLRPSNDEFWQKSDFTKDSNNIDVPSLIISGWYDDDGEGTSEAWEMMNKHNRDNVKLILGPWYHKANTTRDINDIHFGDNAILYDMDILYLKWFDKFLKDKDNKIDEGKRVKYYLVGENEWREDDNWPPENNEVVKLYIGNDSKALFEKPEEDGKAEYIFDPDDPFPFLIDISENELNIPANYKEEEKRDDVLIYTSEVLDEDLTIAGNLKATLYASTSGKDTDFVVRLTDVDEDGNSIRVSDGILRARYRNGFEDYELLVPNEVYKFEIRMSKIAYVFKKGHKLRIQVTSGAKNLSFPNCNTGEDPQIATKFIKAKQTIYYGKNNQSYIELPVIK